MATAIHVIISGRRHRVSVFEVGQRFAHAAKVRIGGKEIRSRDVPFSFRRAALDSLQARVREQFPNAQFDF